MRSRGCRGFRRCRRCQESGIQGYRGCTGFRRCRRSQESGIHGYRGCRGFGRCQECGIQGFRRFRECGELSHPGAAESRCCHLPTLRRVRPRGAPGEDGGHSPGPPTSPLFLRDSIRTPAPRPGASQGGLPQGTGGSRGGPGGYWGPPARNPPARRPPPRPPDPAVPATAAPPRARRSRGRPVRWGEKPREGARGPLHWDRGGTGGTDDGV